MNQELLDLLHGELPEDQAQALKKRLASDPALARELEELEALFNLMRRGEEIEPAPETRDRVYTAAVHATAPGLWEQVKALPGLFRFRFRKSVAFRIAAVSLGAHLIAMAVLFQFSLAKEPGRTGIDMTVVEEDAPDLRPDASYVARLKLRRLHGARLKRLGLPGQQQTIDKGIDALLAGQESDGSFGDSIRTGYVALTLLAEGDCSVYDTRRGRAVRAAVDSLLSLPATDLAHGAILTALLEDWALSYDELGEAERARYVRAIRRHIRDLDHDDPLAAEAFAVARQADFPVPARYMAGIFERRASELLADAPTRSKATALMARGLRGVDLDRAARWARPLFKAAREQIESGKVTPHAVLTLQAPYRL
ncbi:MAG: anti-sigma factor [Planctomycetota bacterium]|jgi:hypothetical protein